jgi:peptidoglycan/xylan/chitin deacetylase (PgdA/CDA1 family)
MLKAGSQNQKMILTFDYELALGRDTGTINKCMIEPTEKILELMRKYNAKGIFFVDASFLLFLKKTKDDSIVHIQKQLKIIFKNGNDIGLHLHPQWLDAYKIKKDRWSFKNYKHYRLHSLSDREVEDQFENGIKLLNELIGDKKYKIKSFRAGGWAVQPFAKIKSQFLKNKLLYDFSVNPGLLNNTIDGSYFDFTKAPFNMPYYKFEDDPCIISDNGKFIEIPVTTVKTIKLTLWLNYYLYKKNDIISCDGKMAENKKSDGKRKINKIIENVFQSCYSAVSIDGLSNYYFKRFINKIDKNILFSTFVCHPKMLSKESYKNLDTLLKKYSTLGINELDRIIK